MTKEQKSYLQRQLDTAIDKIDELETELDRLEDENKRLKAKVDWLQDRIVYDALAEQARAARKSWGDNAY